MEEAIKPGEDVHDQNASETAPPLPLEITNEMILNEEKLVKSREEKETKMREEEALALDKEEKKRRLVRLNHLLTQSTFYASFIERQLATQKVAAARKIENANSQNSESKPKGNQGSQKKNKRKSDCLAKDKELLDKQKSSGAQLDNQQMPISTEGFYTTDAGLVVSSRQPLLFEGGVMRDYQLDGCEWLIRLYLNGLNGILADEMGLGKTIQCIALISYLVQQKIPGPFLIVGPLSTLSNWMSEFERFAPKLPVVLYHGNPMERFDKLKQLKKHTQVPHGNSKGVLPIVLTSYEVAMKDRTQLQGFQWQIVVIDEGHRIKNFNCRLVRELKMYRSNNRLLLTGTPLQNNLTELWSLLNYLLPDIFSELTIFESWFEATDLSTEEGNLEAASERVVKLEQCDNVVSTIHKILHPFMLRRTKAEVDLQIPPKKELLVFTPLTSLQEKLYRAILDNSIHDLLAPKEDESRSALSEEEAEVDEPQAKKRRRRTCTLKEKHYNIDNSEKALSAYGEQLQEAEQSSQRCKRQSHQTLTINQGYISSLNASAPVMDMRKVVNHPYLLRFPVHPGTKNLVINEELVTSSGKMMVLDAMLTKLTLKGHKVLIFSQLCIMLDLIEEYLMFRKYKFCRLDGSHNYLVRQESIKRFNSDPSITVFLLSTRAGGLGINLTAADTVIIYDSDWNPQCDLQAQDRCHRIGQTKPVVVYRFTTDGTIDRRMVERATGKRRLEKIVIKKGRFHGGKMTQNQENSVIPKQELLELLNSKDYVKSISSNGFVYSDAELEELLDRSDLVHGGKVEPPAMKSHLYERLEPDSSNLTLASSKK